MTDIIDLMLSSRFRTCTGDVYIAQIKNKKQNYNTIRNRIKNK